MKLDAASLPALIDKGGVSVHGVNWGELNISRIQFPAGADATLLLRGLEGDLCHVPHWGMVLKGSIHVRYSDDSEELVRAGEAYYWPPGHTVWVDEDYQSMEFSPAQGMTDLIAHLAKKLGTALLGANPPTLEASAGPEATH